MPSLARLLILAVILCCGLAHGYEPPRDVRLPPNPFQVQALDISNSFREKAGKSRLPLDYRLNSTAQTHADLLGSKGYTVFDSRSGHTDFGDGDVQSRAAAFGFHGDLGENLGVNYDDVLHAFHCFTQDPGHYRTLLGDYNACGFGRARNSKGELIVVCVYGRSK